MRNLFLFIILSFSFSVYSVDYEGFYIAHGGGGIEGRISTNSLESLNYSYEQGFRFFELDLIEDIYGKVLHLAIVYLKKKYVIQQLLR